MYAPIKNELLSTNHVPCMKKAIRKGIMKMFAVENKYVKSKIKENLKSYPKQRNVCSKLGTKERKIPFERLD